MLKTPLKMAREKRGITPQQLAAEVGVTQPTINRIENGKKRASLDLADRLSKFFGGTVTRDQILFPADYAKPIKPSSALPTRRRAQLQEAS